MKDNFYRSIMDLSWDWEYLVSSFTKKILYTTPSAEYHTGYKAEEFLNDSSLLEKIVHPDDLHPWLAYMEEHNSVNKYDSPCQLDYRIITKSGETKWFSQMCKPFYDEYDNLVGLLNVARDISDIKMGSKISEARTKLHRYASEHSLYELLAAILNEAKELTSSTIGFYHLLEDDQESLSLQAWSTEAEEEFCCMQTKNEHFGVDNNSAWAECVRERQAVIYNDFASLQNGQDLPQETASITRMAIAPVFRADKIVAILGVGNKNSDYTEKDIDTVSKIADLAWDIVVQKQTEESLRELAHFDLLTKLPNRVMLADRMQLAMSHAKRVGELVAVCVLDLDGFKPVNDTYGHKAGDIVLQHIAKRLLHSIRGDDTAARLGGDEFALLLGGFKNIQDSEKAMHRIIEDISQPIDLRPGKVRVGASIGVTFYPIDGSGADTLIRHADIAMYEAKQSGKNKFCFFDNAHEQKLKANQSALKKIVKGIKEGDFCLYYQPKVDCRNGKVVGFEALVRWQHPIFGIIAPSQFMPLIENDEAIVDLGYFVINEALTQMKQWKEEGISLPVSVNIASKQLRRLDFFDQLKELLKEHDYDSLGAPIEIEILESAALEDVNIVSDLINRSKSIGVNFSLDDFGTGYSSLMHLKHLGADTLKIDQTFVRDLLDDPEDLAITEAIIGLSEAFDRKVVAEGVESIEHILLLLEMGCNVMQGYCISKPMPSAKVHEWIKGFKVDPRWTLTSVARPSKEDFWLLLADANHRYWVESIISASKKIDTIEKALNVLPLKIDECRFGQWYYSDGRKRYRRYDEFVKIEALHKQAHTYAYDLLQRAANNDSEGLEQNKNKFMEVSSQIISTLSKLKNAVIAERKKIKG